MTIQCRDLNVDILENGRKADNRTVTPTLAVFGREMRYDLKKAFPAITQKRAFMRGAKVELCWFLKGLTNTDYLNQHNVEFWNKWALEEDVTEEIELVHYERFDLYVEQLKNEDRSPVDRAALLKEFNAMNIADGVTRLNEAGIPKTKTKVLFKKGDLGPVYGAMLRRFPDGTGGHVDQLKELQDALKNNPTSRRHVVSLWFPALLPDESISPQENVKQGKMSLAPCHWMFEVMVEPMTFDERWAALKERVSNVDQYRGNPQIESVFEEFNVPVNRLNFHMHLRSNDAPAGLPVNLCFYASLAYLLADHANMDVGEIWYTGTNVHIYHDQVPMVEEMLTREVKAPTHKFVIHNRRENLWDYEPEDFDLEGYDPHPAIRVPTAV